jgi:hypothetical protein
MCIHCLGQDPGAVLGNSSSEQAEANRCGQRTGGFGFCSEKNERGLEALQPKCLRFSTSGKDPRGKR